MVPRIRGLPVRPSLTVKVRGVSELSQGGHFSGIWPSAQNDNDNSWPLLNAYYRLNTQPGPARFNPQP